MMLQRQTSGLLATTLGGSSHGHSHSGPGEQPAAAAAADSVILEEEYDPHYEPTAEEIQEYATFLDMDLSKDEDLLWIAREGLKVGTYVAQRVVDWTTRTLRY